MKYYAIKRPDGSWIIGSGCVARGSAFMHAYKVETQLRMLRNGGGEYHAVMSLSELVEAAEDLGYTCVEVNGFTEVKLCRE